jgi:hypothetical protein
MISALAAVALALAALGIGCWVLERCKYDPGNAIAQLAVGFAVGMGLLGWVAFWFGALGILRPAAVLMLVAVGLIALWPYRSLLKLEDGRAAMSRVSVVLLVGLVASIGIDMLEAFAPAVEGDTMAYHFALPKHFLHDQRIAFVPVAVEGAVPLLTHMTYALAMALGGEQAAQIWLLLTQLGLLAAVYGLARRWLTRDWALAVTLLLNTTPAMILGAGTGHVETRTALYMLVGVVAAVDAIRTQSRGAVVVAGLAAGFFAGSKYYGLFAAFAIGAVLLSSPRRWALAGTFAMVALLAGGQWYAWIWVNSGMPIFPTLYSVFGAREGQWNAQIASFFKTQYSGYSPLPTDLATFVSYPFLATLAPPVSIESGRAGFGPFMFLALPWVLASTRQWRTWFGGDLVRIAAAGFLFYSLWFWIPTNQLTRQLLPIYPLGLIVVAVAATKWSEANAYQRQWGAALAVSILFGFLIHLAYSTNYVRYYARHESRTQFQERNIAFASVADWVNGHLGDSVRVGNPVRSINYLLDVPYMSLDPAFVAQVELHPRAQNLRTFVGQLGQQHLTHLLVYPSLDSHIKPGYGIVHLARKAVAAGCAEPEQRIPSLTISSRTMGLVAPDSVDLVRLTPASPACRSALGQDAFAHGGAE